MKALTPANTNVRLEVVEDPSTSKAFFERLAFEAFRAFVVSFRNLIEVGPEPQAALAPPEAAGDVMTADEVSVFLGVDRNTVYDFAGRGVIPHQRLGKRLLFRRAAVVAWLDSSVCKATSTRKE